MLTHYALALRSIFMKLSYSVIGGQYVQTGGYSGFFICHSGSYIFKVTKKNTLPNLGLKAVLMCSKVKYHCPI
jgi:hypothetical protein